MWAADREGSVNGRDWERLGLASGKAHSAGSSGKPVVLGLSAARSCGTCYLVLFMLTAGEHSLSERMRGLSAICRPSMRGLRMHLCVGSTWCPGSNARRH